MDEVLTIGQLAQRAGIGVSTIRFYEQKGLIEGPPRNKSGYRLYPPKMVEKVRLIKHRRDLGSAHRGRSFKALLYRVECDRLCQRSGPYQKAASSDHRAV